jgi:hypothetical protein
VPGGTGWAGDTSPQGGLLQGNRGCHIATTKTPEISPLADEIGMPITVCHYPPGTSKWNKIEHRLFSFISLNWRVRPLVNYETVVNLIGATKTRTGLRVKAVLDTGTHPKGIKVEEQAMRDVQLSRHTLHPDWNYTIDSLTS